MELQADWLDAQVKRAWRSPAVATHRPLSLVLIAVLAATAAEAQRAYPLAYPRGCRDRSCVRGRAISSGAPPPAFTLNNEYDFGVAAGNPPAKPSFSDATLNTYTDFDSSCNLRMWSNDGGTASETTITGGAGATCRLTSWGWYAQVDVEDATGYATSGQSKVPTTLFAGDFAVATFGYTNSNGGATNKSVIANFDTNLGPHGYWNSNLLQCVFSEKSTTTTATVSGTAGFDNWALQTCHRTGNDHYANLSGADGTVVTHSFVPVAAGTIGDWFGWYPSAGQEMGGQLAWNATYSADKTAAQLSTIMWTALGIPSGATPAATTAILCYNADAGPMDCLGSEMMTDYTGAYILDGETTKNYGGSDNLDITTWTAFGGAGAVTNVAPGPMYYWKSANELDRVVAPTAATYGGYKSANTYLRSGDLYNVSAYLSIGDGGTSNGARLAIITNGTFADGGQMDYCDITGLTATPTLYGCTSSVLDAGNSVQGEIGCVGSCSVTVGEPSSNYGRFWARRPFSPTNAAVGDTYAALDTSAWPTFSTALGGEVEIVFAPSNNMNSDLAGSASGSGVTYLMDSYDNSNTHLLTLVLGYNTPGSILVRFGSSAGGVTDISGLTGITLTTGVMYAAKMSWYSADGYSTCVDQFHMNTCSGTVASCHATTLLGATSGGTCADNPTHSKIGQRFDTSVPSNVSVFAVRVNKRT